MLSKRRLTGTISNYRFYAQSLATASNSLLGELNDWETDGDLTTKIGKSLAAIITSLDALQHFKAEMKRSPLMPKRRNADAA
ncbi:hypothetical protein [Rhizobium sp. BK251]|uniref:hypothetical protein n=1 Tax=Rhizobium sp. BK251 TaxID=2512125 RepID=UPI00104749E4|nr:hypothetical protein [Rhizobium sp. BK251]TCL65111.1 hypothetical protein EV286_1136 [Rhizobium sp. BK251]